MELQPGDPTGAKGEAEIFLDGLPVELPWERHSLSAVRSYLESLSLEKQCVLCSLAVDGQTVNLGLPLTGVETFSRIDAESVALDDSEVLLLKTALQQTGHARECVETALTLVLINSSSVARELWWNIALLLKGPILTLSLLPDHLGGQANGVASFKKIRKWQLEQVATIIREVDRACKTNNTFLISDTLEKRVLPWLCKMDDLLSLWHETALAGSRLRLKNQAF
jgi:hypothetical protein